MVCKGNEPTMVNFACVDVCSFPTNWPMCSFPIYKVKNTLHVMCYQCKSTNIYVQTLQMSRRVYLDPSHIFPTLWNCCKSTKPVCLATKHPIASKARPRAFDSSWWTVGGRLFQICAQLCAHKSLCSNSFYKLSTIPLPQVCNATKTKAVREVPSGMQQGCQPHYSQ